MKKFLYDHAASRPISFHMPGHKGGALYKKYGYEEFLENFMDMDVTEIPGADNLFDASGIIDDVQRRYAALYGAERSWLVVGGTSASLIASVLTVLERSGAGMRVAENETDTHERSNVPKLIMARNCHKSVFNGLALAKGQPIYAYPDIDEEYGIAGEVTADEIRRCIKENPDAAAVLVTSPNYYGICSDIKAIADVTHEAGMVLIVDQAHGAHLKFFHKYNCENVSHPDGSRYVMPMAAEDQGADLVANSIHKTLASMTQSAVLNLCSDRIDPEVISDKLQMIESSSPSYILMMSLDINAELLEQHGRELIGSWRDDLEWFYDQSASESGFRLMGPGKTAKMDLTKLNIDSGIPGHQLEQMLNEKGIFPELYTGNILMCMTGIGNVRSDYEKLLHELSLILSQWKDVAAEIRRDKLPAPGEMKEVPKEKKKVLLKDSEGHICAAPIIPYPPGVPIVCPGEKITREMIEYLECLIDENHKIIGIDEKGCILTGKKLDK